MQTERNSDLRFAVLIDADNVPYSSINEILEEIAKYGIPTFKRIYADWTKPTVSGWKNVLLEHAITPVQQYSYTTGKNSTDSAMIIDAMDILYSGRVDGFCIVSSDSDFTRLAVRLREAGMKVIGIGQKKTPKALISACEKFIYIEILKRRQDKPEVVQKEVVQKDKKPEASTQPIIEETAPGEDTHAEDTIKPPDKNTVDLIASSVSDLGDESGWAFLGDVGNLILKKTPDFDSRNYGFRKLAQLVKSLDAFEIDERRSENGTTKLVFIRMKREPAKAVRRPKKAAPKPRTDTNTDKTQPLG